MGPPARVQRIQEARPGSTSPHGVQTTMAASASSVVGQPDINVIIVCSKCRQPPAAGDKLRFCARCKSARYCSVACLQDDWSQHKAVCKDRSAARKGANARCKNRVPGSAKSNLKELEATLLKW